MTKVLAHKRGLELFITAMVLQGSMCDECAHGTRRTSAKWAKCKKCGKRMQRRTNAEVEAAMRKTK